jgi:carboxyl-terminal processing protease
MKPLATFAAGLAAGVCLSVGIGALAQGSKMPEATLQQFRKLAEVFNTVKTTFAGDAEERKMFDGCVAGLLRKLDSRSEYLDQQEFANLKAPPPNPPGGIGVDIRSVSGRVEVVSPIEDSPADRAGIVSGDLIIAIDGIDTATLSLGEVVKALRGPAGSAVKLALLRRKATSTVDIEVSRELIRINSVRWNLLPQGTGYVRISQFREETPERLVRALESLKAKNGAPLKGLVLDLRDNPGGLLHSGVAVAASVLADDVPIVSTVGPSFDSRRRFNANPLDYRGLTKDFRERFTEFPSIPIVVLVNSGSAAASEIVAASLQHYNRATLVGEKTFGRGSIQTIFPLSDGTAIKVTSAHFFTPSGSAIEATGVTPNIFTEASSKSPLARYGSPADEPLRRALEVLKNL